MTFEALGEQLLAALPSLPLYSISLHNDRGELLWINEGDMGPLEQSFAEEALQVLGAEPEQPSYENVLDDGRAASVIPVRTPRGDLLGLILIITAPTGEPLAEQLMTPQLRAIMRKLGVLMRPSIPSAAPEPAPRARTERRAAPQRPAAPERRAPPPAREPEPVEQPEPMYSEAYPQEAYAEGEYAAEEAYAQEEAPAEDAAYAEDAYAAQYAAAEPEPEPQPPQRPQRYVERPAPARPATAPVARQPAAAQPAAREAPARQGAARQNVAARPARAPVRAAAPRQSAPRARVPAAAPRAPSNTAAPQTSQPPQRVPPGYRRVAQQPRPAARPPISQVRAAAARTYPAPRPQAPEPALQRVTPAGRRLAEAVQTQFAARGATAQQRPAYRTPPPEPRVLLELLPFVSLRGGARGRRFEVLPHVTGGETPDGLDSTAVQELVGWLGTHRGLWSLEPTSFTINLSIATLEDERFLPDTAQALRSQGIQAETLGFEIAEALYTQNRALVERFVSLCDKSGCFLAIDDFSFDPAVLSLLRSRAVRLVKVDARLTGALQRDKLSEALVTAIIQATRVLGVQCAAKAVESQSLLQWLTAAGCDVAQGPAVSGPQPLEALGTLG